MQTWARPSPRFATLAQFVRGLRFSDIPLEIREFAALLLLDCLGVGAAASRLGAGRIARDHAARHWAAGTGAPSARLLFDGRRVSLPGAIFALATQIDNLDAHDGWQPSKGHAGVALAPALCAFAEDLPELSGARALTALVIGYEIAYRAAAALHATTTDYHTSGAWNALGVVALGARLRDLPEGKLREALGIAEFHAPRSQMMREIANPSMLHDGSALGAPIGAQSLLLAEEGFLGAPAATVEFDDAAFAWGDLGKIWLTGEQYIKNYPTCRWTHAPIDAALSLRTRHGIDPMRIARIEIATFQYSADLWKGAPSSTGVAQYSLAWPVAAALARGCVGVEEVLESSFGDPLILRLLERVEMRVADEYERAYPAERLADVVIVLDDGRKFESGPTTASGGPRPRPGRAEIEAKFLRLATPALGEARAAAILAATLGLTAEGADFKALVEALAGPP